MSYNLSLDLYLKNIFVLFLEPCYFRDALWSQLYSFVAYILAVMWDKVCQNWCYNTVPRRLHLVLFKHNGLVLCFSCTIFFFFITVFSGLTSPSHRVSFSDVTSARVSGCAAMWIFKRFAITQCLGWRKELCTSSEYVVWTRPVQGAPPKPRSPSSLQTPWNTPGLWVTH